MRNSHGKGRKVLLVVVEVEGSFRPFTHQDLCCRHFLHFPPGPSWAVVGYTTVKSQHEHHDGGDSLPRGTEQTRTEGGNGGGNEMELKWW